MEEGLLRAGRSLGTLMPPREFFVAIMGKTPPRPQVLRAGYRRSTLSPDKHLRLWRVCLLARAGLARIPLRPTFPVKIPTPFTGGMESHWKPLALLGAPSAPAALSHTHAGWRQKFSSYSSEAKEFRVKEQAPSVSGECPFPESWMAPLPGRRPRTAPREEPWSLPKAPPPSTVTSRLGISAWALGGRHAYQACVLRSLVPASRAVPMTSGGRGRLCHFRLPGFNTQLWLLIQAFCYCRPRG